jgi:hypothetical protein
MVAPDPFTAKIIEKALSISGKKLETVNLPRAAEPFTHTLAISTASVTQETLPTSIDPLFLEAMKIANEIREKNLKRQVLCAIYRRFFRMSDIRMAIFFPGTRSQRDQWVRRGLLRLCEKASPDLLAKLNTYRRGKGSP